MDLDPTTTVKGDQYSVASISFHYGGSIIETRKEVQTIFESLSNIGNIFNILLTIFKVINNYYSNKKLLVDIFKTVFFGKENINLINKENIHLHNSLDINKNKKNNLNISDEIGFNNDNINKIKFINASSKKMILSSGNNYVINKKSKTYVENQENITKNKIMYYYLLPFWFLRRNKTLNNIYFIKDRIYGYFSIEKINELIRFKESFEDKSMKSKKNNTEFIQINKFSKFGNKDINDGNTPTIQIIK